ncbi:MAG TPA: hypothetical protein PK299_14195 [Anaerolineales bacterium]|nr:hypothetical protein [Anaerolineales bacterium]
MFADLTQAEDKRRKKIEAALKQLQENPRVMLITIQVSAEACPACQAVRATYPKHQVAELPWEACSCPHGCTATYVPVFNEIYP